MPRALTALFLVAGMVACDEKPAPAPPSDACRLACETEVERCYEQVCWDRWGEAEAKAPDEDTRREIVEDMVVCRRACSFHTERCLADCASAAGK